MQLVLIHGIGNSGLRADQILHEWIEALVSGGAERERIAEARPVVAYYADLLSAGRIERGFEVLLREDPDKAIFLAETANEMQAAYRGSSLRKAKALLRQSETVADPGLAELVQGTSAPGLPDVLGLLDEVYDYLTKPGLRAAIDARVGAAFTDQTSVVIGHSLGSVVAYRQLRIRASKGLPAARRLITCGSPLSFRTVRRLIDQTFTYPEQLGDWRNAFDGNDPVALGRAFPMPTGGSSQTVRHARVRNPTLLHHMADGYLRTAPMVRWTVEALG